MAQALEYVGDTHSPERHGLPPIAAVHDRQTVMQ